MMSPFEQSVDAWLSSMEVRLRGFVRGDLFLIAQTPDKEWWAQVIDDATVTAVLIKDLVAEAKLSVGGCLEASQGRSKRISVKGKQVYAYQLIYWAGNALIPSSEDVVRHKCHNRRCINPMHLTHGTQLDNVNDTRDR
ncbi:HNH endonuclease [Lentibacter algarum]|uniref:HNH endonuclease n=1 Tax=Lentibacter algarum TaxID=576131 RepID=UPI0024924D06|nr:HNH endonuclease [Lentibacter algarum]